MNLQEMTFATVVHVTCPDSLSSIRIQPAGNSPPSDMSMLYCESCSSRMEVISSLIFTLFANFAAFSFNGSLLDLGQS